MRRRFEPFRAGLLLALALATDLAAAPRPPGGAAITGLRLVLPNGRIVEDGTIVVRDGRIVAAGEASRTPVPADVAPRDGKGLTAYPGLIEIHDTRERTPKVEGEPGNLDLPPDPLPLLGDAARNRKLREAGFVASLVSTKGGILGGESLFASLGDGSADSRLLARDRAQNVALRPAKSGYPASLMGAIAATRQAFADARWHGEAEAAYALDSGQPRPAWSSTSARLARAARGDQPVVFESDDPLSALRAAALARELGVPAWIAGSGREYERLDELQAAGLPLILPLRYPEKPKAPKPGERGPELDELRAWALAPENPARALRAGLRVALSTFRLDDPKGLHGAIARALKHGLDSTQALAALTSTPAGMLGVESSWGAIAPGRSASFVLVDGELFVESPKIREVWIEGVRHEISSARDEEPRKEDPAAATKPASQEPAPVAMEEGVDPIAAWRSPLPERPAILLVRGATIWTQGPAGRLERGDLLVREGKVVAVAPTLEAPAGAVVLDAAGRHLTPGLIDAHSHSAISGAVNEGTNAVTAEVRVADVLDADDVAIYRELAGGLTTANLLHGSANSIGGQSATIKLRWGAAPAELPFAGAPPGIKFALGENPKQSNWQPKERRFPQTRMGVEQTIRESFLAARDYRAAWAERAALSPKLAASRVPPRRDFQLEAIAEILEGRRLVHAHSYRADEILMLLGLAESFGVKIATLQHGLEAYKVADEIARHGAAQSGFSDWWAYKYEVIDAIPWNAAILHDRGVLVSLNSDSDELARRMNLEAAKAVRYGGMAEEEALGLVTINSARQLGVADRVGSLEPGKDADFVLWSGSPLSTASRVEQTWIDGRKYFDREADLAARPRLERERLARLAALEPPGSEAKPAATPEAKP